MEFLVFPDHPKSSDVLAEFPRDAWLTQRINHPSGRPWLVGNWRVDQLVTASVGGHRVALVGTAATTSERLEHHLAEAAGTSVLASIRGRISGSYHLLSTASGVVTAQGALSGYCQIYLARVPGMLVCANRPDILARLTGAGVDEEVLAGRLLAPAPPYPFDERPVWAGVSALPLGHQLRIGPDGRGEQLRWWNPPDPVVPAAEATGPVRRALQDAVAARAGVVERTGGRLSADLSGGMDSTAICFLGDSAVPDLLTLHRDSPHEGNDDRRWADRALAAMRGADPLVIPGTDIPDMFAGCTGVHEEAEGPFPRTRVSAKIRYSAELLAGRGATTHLTGDGGDELFYPGTPLSHTLVRRDPLAALRRLRVDRAMFRWRWLPTVRGLLSSEPYGHWLLRQAGELTDSLPRPKQSPELGWDSYLRMPAWATADAIGSVRQAMRSARDVEPLSPLIAQHFVLRGIRKGGEVVRRTGRITEGYGIDWHAPFLDDHVVDAALSIDLRDQADPTAYKPTLAAAMRGIVPDELLGRLTKAEFSQGAYEGLNRHRRDLLELATDMELARRGLVDEEAFRAALLDVYPSSRGLTFLDKTVAAEAWLRTVATGSPATERTGVLR